MTVTDFAGVDTFDLAIGEVYGLRVWKMDDYGRLRARNWDKAGPWKPGVNVARCHAETQSVAGLRDPSGKGRRAVDVSIDYDSSIMLAGVVTNRAAGTGARYHVTWDDGSREMLRSVEFAATTHAVPDDKCQCGFYAYSDPKHEETGTRGYATGGWVSSPGLVSSTSYTLSFSPTATGKAPTRYVLGVIRGSGRTLIGTKGFRCEKAEIVALRDPTRGGTKTAEWRTEQLAKLKKVYPEVPLPATRAELLEFAPIQPLLPEAGTDEFWALP